MALRKEDRQGSRGDLPEYYCIPAKHQAERSSGFPGGVRKTCTARSEEFSPLTTAHAIILFYSRSYCNRKSFNSTCSVQGTMTGCTYHSSERSLGLVVDGVPICLLTTTKFDSASTNTNCQNLTAKDSFREGAIASLDKRRNYKGRVAHWKGF